MSNPTPTHATIIDLAVLRRQRSIRVALPGRVESYDATKQKANVQPLIQDGEVDPDTGEREVQRLPVVTDVPIVFPGAGGMRITMPVSVGDTVLLIFSSSSLDRWLQRGGEVDPEDDRRHHISDAVALPGMFDFSHVPTTAPTDAMTLHSTKILLGGPDAADPVVRKSDLANFVAEYKSHVHTGVTTGPGTSAVAATAAAYVTPACSAVVKVK